MSNKEIKSMNKLTVFTFLVTAPLILTVAVPTFWGSFDKVAPATTYALTIVWKTRDKAENEKRHR
jgi:hypothetical protein